MLHCAYVNDMSNTRDNVRFFSFILFIIILFFCLRFIFIVRFPPMEAETTNIRYGQMMVWVPTLRFASLQLASKQPLAYWLFGSATLITKDLVVAPRLISVAFGIITVFFLYLWTRKLFDKQISMVCILLVTVMPVFIIFQSLALMESIILATTVLSIWAVTEFALTHQLIYPVILGFVSAIGFWTKTNSVLISAFSVVVLGYLSFVRTKFRGVTILPVIFALSVCVIFILPLVVQPLFHRVLSDVNTFTFTIRELFEFPIKTWLGNVLHVLYGFFIYGSPLFVLGLIRGLQDLRRKKVLLLLGIAGALLFLPLLFNRAITTRYYLPAFIPITPIVALGLIAIAKSSNIFLKTLFLICIVLTVLLNAVLIYDAKIYFRLFPDRPPFANERGYALGWSSGYATQQALKVLNDPSLIPERAVIAVQDFQGHPTDWVVSTYFFNNNRPIVFINTAKELNRLDVFKNTLPVYFVTRSNLYYEDLKPYLTKLHEFQSPNSSDYIEIYQMSTKAL